MVTPIIRHVRIHASRLCLFSSHFTVVRRARRWAIQGCGSFGIGRYRTAVQDFSCNPSRRVQCAA
jgi:hypothetical protein